ncbi:MAG: type I-E CRISPR-associated protein Cse1/CasA [Burkholderiales bacterium]|nr:type I-E CRISPR-associated protein Cse1/CasA [Burkholderiales bacterium]
MTQGFNLLDTPWLPVRLGSGEVQAVGLLEAVRRCGEITALAETAPPSLVAEYRLLLAIVHRALVHSRGRWADADRLSWYRAGLPVDEVCAYLEAWRARFDVFGADHPFLQVAALREAAETRDKRKSWTQISLASANGNAPVVFDHSIDTEPVPIAPAAAVAHLLGFLQFTPGGLVKTLRDADKAGPLANTAAVLPVGATLAHTLCLNLHAAPLPGQPEDDRPAWERPPLTLGQLRGDPVLPSGPNDRYTRQTRAVLLDREADGSVKWLRFAAGWALADDPQAPDPMACFRAGSNGLVRVSFTEGRALWRDLPALVPAPQQGYQAAQVVQRAASLHQLSGQGRGRQALLVAGLASDQAKLLRWRMEQVALPEALLLEPDRALELRAHVATAETVYQQLRQTAVSLVADTLPDPKSKDTRSRARGMVESGPLAATYFAAAQSGLAAVMQHLADDEFDAAQRLWQRTLRQAANRAWQQLLVTLGSSPRAWRADARWSGLMHRWLHAHLAADELTPPASHLQEHRHGA